MDLANGFEFGLIIIKQKSPPAVCCDIYIPVISNIYGNAG
jgi:hypothetical protein